MPRLFGTDGVRGTANSDLTAELALRLGRAAAQVLAPTQSRDGRARVVVGRDPRASGEFLEAAVTAGLASAGADVHLVGVVPTPATAFLTARLEADFGVMLSASHNPMPDNGIKIFAAGGHKLPDAVEDQLEAALEQPILGPIGAGVGRVHQVADSGAEYVGHLLAAIPNRVGRLRLVVDCANGAASAVGPDAYRLAGADVTSIASDPDGLNINLDCGSTHLDGLVDAVIASRADIGIAHDGDADRCLAVDATGRIVDGDQLMAILALAMHEAGTLANDTVVATVMSNLGFKQAMRAAGINVIETDVGDRYVLEAMRAGGFNLGGEQSGHVILGDHATTGDGILTGLMILARMSATGQSLAQLAGIVEPLPQVLVNVSGVDRARLAGDAMVASAVEHARQTLGDTGRILLRPSGTEPLVRVMVEAPTQEQADQVADDVARAVRAQLAVATS